MGEIERREGVQTPEQIVRNRITYYIDLLTQAAGPIAKLSEQGDRRGLQAAGDLLHHMVGLTEALARIKGEGFDQPEAANTLQSLLPQNPAQNK